MKKTSKKNKRIITDKILEIIIVTSLIILFIISLIIGYLLNQDMHYERENHKKQNEMLISDELNDKGGRLNVRG